MGLYFRTLAEKGYESLVRLFQGAERTLGQIVEPLVEMEDEVGGLRRFPTIPRREAPGGWGGDQDGEDEEEPRLTNDHERRTGARLSDSAAGAERKSYAAPAAERLEASAIGCAPWEGETLTQAPSAPHGHPGHERSQDRRSLVLALMVTATIMILEAVGGWISGSLALQADAGHMLVDSSSLLLAILAISFASRPADHRRTYGFYRAEILAALVNGALLLGVAVLIFWEAIQRLRSPSEIQIGTMLGVALVGLGANAVSMLLLHKRSHGSLNVRGAYLHVIGDALSSVGVVTAAVVIHFTGWLFVDALVSLAIALVIVWGALRLLREATDVLLEAVPAHLDLAEILHAMEAAEGVNRIHDLHVWTISSGMHALSAHVVIDSCDLGQNDEILGSLQTILADRFGLHHVTLQIETPAHCG